MAESIPPLRIREADGSPNLIPVFDLIISGATLTRVGASGAQLLFDSGAAGAPAGAPYVTYSANATLTAERILTAGSSVTIVTDATNVYVNALTGGGATTVYAPTGGTYLTYAPDADLTAERILIAGTGVTVASDGTNFFTSVNSNIRDKVFSFFAAGTLSTAMRIEESRIYAPFNMEVRDVRLAVATTPVGGNIIVNVGQFGTPVSAMSAFYTSANRPVVVTGGSIGSGGSLANTVFYVGSYLGCSLDQVGTTSSGQDLTITVLVRTS